MKNEILAVIKKYAGVKEIGKNQGFDNKEFESLLVSVGWKKGESYCSYTVKAILKEAGQTYNFVSPSAWKTALNAITTGLPWETKPNDLCLIVWRQFKDWKPQAAGHIGFAINPTPNNVTTFEGNADGIDADKIQGFEANIRSIRPDKWRVDNGLRLMGFIYLDLD